MSAFASLKWKVTKGWESFVTAISVVLALFVALVPTPAYAASGLKCYTIGTANTPVYSSSGLSTKIGAIYSSDEVTINSFSSSKTAVNVTYPISGGRMKSGWIRTSAILSATGGYAHNSARRYTTYRRPGGSSYGSVYVGDQVVVLGIRSGYTQIRYPVSGGFKFAWARTSDVNAGKAASAASSAKPTTTPKPMATTATGSSSTAVRQRLDQIANGSLRYNSSTNMRLNTKFTGTRSGEQCKGFAKNVFYLCFKVTPGSTQGKPYNYLLNSTGGMTRVGYYSNITSSQAKSLFSKARPGDFVQMRRRSKGGSHSAIVYSVSSGGITFFEANTDNCNTVKKQYYTWAQLSSRNVGMSLYTASSYNLK